MDIEVLDTVAGLGPGWRFRAGAEFVTVRADGVLVDPPPAERQIRDGDRFAYWDDLMLEAADWLVSETTVTELHLVDGSRYDVSLLALDRAPVPRFGFGQGHPRGHPGAPATGLAPASRPNWRAMAWAHHFPEQYDRCAIIGGRPVCRRCLVLYPLAVLAAVVSLVALGGAWAWDPHVLWLVPLPATVEFVGEQLGWWTYAKWRQVAVMVPMALAFGRGVGRYLDDASDRLFWTVLLVNGAAWALAAFLGHQRRERAAWFEPGAT